VAERAVRGPLDLGVATRSRPGEAANGDLAVVSLTSEGVLIAAIDGLGHGGAAAVAARTAGRVVRERPSRDLVLLAELCHDALRDTRGAAIGLAFVCPPEATMTWLGVGNVEGRVLGGTASAVRPKGSLAPGRGVLGHQLPSISAATLDVVPGDVLVLATDGIRAVFADYLDVSGSAQAITERILAVHRRPTDDALVVAVRYLGPGS
jgi:phosphoserine phosphatase RsbX